MPIAMLIATMISTAASTKNKVTNNWTHIIIINNDVQQQQQFSVFACKASEFRHQTGYFNFIECGCGDPAT